MTDTRAALAFVLLLAGGLAQAGVGRASAASAAPSASPDPGVFSNLEAWLDTALPSDAPAGSTIAVGLTIWDSQQSNFLAMNGLYLKLQPATGKGHPTEAEIVRADWPGHFMAHVIVPKGGPGAVEVVVRDETDLPIQVDGVGPPAAAPLSALVGAQVHLPSKPVTAGLPLDLVVDVRPQADWEPPINLPDRLVVIATLGRGPDLANVEIHLAAGSTTTYTGPITIPAAGDVSLVFAFPGGTSGADDVIPGATTRVKVGTAETSDGPRATAPATDGGQAWPLIGGAVALVVAAAFVIRRVFADL